MMINFPLFYQVSKKHSVDGSLNSHNFFLIRWYHSIKILIKKYYLTIKLKKILKVEIYKIFFVKKIVRPIFGFCKSDAQ